MTYSNLAPKPLAVASREQGFGGSWTSQKLEAMASYHAAYHKVMKNQGFHLMYIDAFAGSGQILQDERAETGEWLFPELREEETERFIEGSAIVALQSNPPYHEYIFIEKKQKYASKLEDRITQQFSEIESRTQVINGDANEKLKEICLKRTWKKTRAVLFLDPYGMQVSWETLNLVAQTKTIDVWYLFPLFAVNRLLPKDGVAKESHRALLTRIFGTPEWESQFYRESAQTALFKLATAREKCANVDSIEKFFLDRLRTIFPHVAPKAGRLYNSKDSPLYLLCFAAGNEKGGKIAVRIANDLIRKI